MSGSLILELQSSLGFSSSQLQQLIIRSPYTYKKYPIPKKSGGFRIIAQPAKETKLIQRWLILNVFDKLPVHECATAYSRGTSIKMNAIRHIGGSYFSKFDFKQFFPSISELDIASHLYAHLGGSLTKEEIYFAARLSCMKSAVDNHLCLSIGAPSSPLLSNTVMFNFDQNIYLWSKERGIAYTRYADDLTFSSLEKGLASDIEAAIRRAIQEIPYPRLALNEEKTTHVSKKHQRRVTGIIINNEGKLSLGRDRKRLITSLIHRFTVGQLPALEVFRLQGLLGFAIDVEPTFMTSMRVKYGSPTIDEILKKRKPQDGVMWGG